jgi:site-specific DNA-cytosine methylase
VSTRYSGINVLSFFDGVSAGQEALRQLGVPVANYFAIEIDEDAIKVTQKNFPNTIQVGNITHITEVDDNQISDDYTFIGKITGSSLIRFVKSLPEIDLVFAGSPCQGFSVSGKSLGFDDPRSKLFFNFIQIFNAIKSYQESPNLKFFFENVKMHKKWKDVISNHLKVRPVFIDALDYSPCARQRMYWTNLEIPESVIQKYKYIGGYNSVFEPTSISSRLARYNQAPIEFRKSSNANTICSVDPKLKSRQGYRVSKFKGKMPTFLTAGNGLEYGLGMYAVPTIRVDVMNAPFVISVPRDVQMRLRLGHNKYIVIYPSIAEASKAMGFSREYFGNPNLESVTMTDYKNCVRHLGNSWSVTVVKLMIDAYCTRKGWVR